MRSAPHLFNEDARLAVLAEYDLVGGEREVDLDAIVELARRIFDVPIVLVSVIERTCQHIKASHGLEICEIDRKTSFCAHALGLDDLLIVPDATLDLRFADNPFVTGEPGIRFYAGMPLRGPGGLAIGTLCIVDRRPRVGLSPREQEDLRALGGLILDKLELRRLAVARAAGQSRFENIAATSPDGIVCADSRGVITFWNAAAERLFGFSAIEAMGRTIDLIVPERMHSGHGGGLARVAAGGERRLVGTTVELDAMHKDGTEFPIELSLSMWREQDQASFGAIMRDISERRANEERLFALAHLDGLTGLPNRTVLMKRIAECTGDAEPSAVLMVDLDGFKDVNDSLGHTAGDEVLRQVATRLRECVRLVDTVARLGGDEFAILMPGCPGIDQVAGTADCLLGELSAPFTVADRSVHVSASIGIALFPRDGDHVEDLLSAADLAMYQAKAEGRDCRRFFVPGLRDAANRKHAFEGEVRRALELGELELFYQPQVRVTDGAVLGVEALLRWRHPDEGVLPPDRFLSAVESGLLAAEVGRWVLERACQDAVTIRRIAPDLTIGINLFGAQFRTGRLAGEITTLLDHLGLPPSAIELEVTENIILRHDDTMLAPLRELRTLGVGIAFDDFGTGFASLSLLKRYPLSRIKIDRGFVHDVVEDRVDAAIVHAIAFLAHSLGVEVIAEGVETAGQRDLVRAAGCTVVQGYLYGRPMPLAELLPALAGQASAAA